MIGAHSFSSRWNLKPDQTADLCASINDCGGQGSCLRSKVAI